MLLALALGPALALDPEDDHALLPSRKESAADIRAEWIHEGSYWQSEPRSWIHGGNRVSAIVEAPSGVPYAAEARGVGANGEAGPWIPLRETFANPELRVWVAELDADYPSAQVRIADRLPTAIGWELRVPVNEPRRPAGSVPPPSSALSSTLRELGVISRDTWGARPTDCTSTEDDWYRMAVHHTAGNTTYGGTVQGAVQALQAYAMDGGTYCDIPYQFLVGYDGTLWEGRELTYTSGATGGGNNDGNIAMCFLGCFHPSSCPGGAGDAATDAMIAWSRLLAATLAAEHGFSINSDTVRGHQDWPGNQTACPGDYVMDRMGEIRSASARFQASFVAQSFPTSSEALVLAPGEELEGWIELTNTGTDAWSPDWTWLAPTPRDIASPIQGADWASSTRIVSPTESVAPGQTARFTFSVRAPGDGEEVLQTFGLVQEWFTWFSDRPYGGGPTDSLLAVRVRGDASLQSPDDSATGDDSGPNSPSPDVGETPGLAVRIAELGCSSGGQSRGVWLLASLALALRVGRRARP